MTTEDTGLSNDVDFWADIRRFGKDLAHTPLTPSARRKNHWSCLLTKTSLKEMKSKEELFICVFSIQIYAYLILLVLSTYQLYVTRALHFYILPALLLLAK